MVGFAELQPQLGAVLALNTNGGSAPHVVVALPSLSVGESLLAHYAERIPALEHRYLLAQLMLPRIPGCELVFISCQAPTREVLDYYLSLVPADRRDSMRDRLTLLEVPDRSARSVAAKLLDRPDLIAELRASFRGRPAFIEPWNVTEHEVGLAEALGVPINGTSPQLWPLGFKSAGRRLFAEAGVPVPRGREDVRSVEDVVDAVTEIQASRPAATGVVVKTDDSGAGDGNRVLPVDRSTTPDDVRRMVHALPDWYRADLAGGGVVEELVAGSSFASPSVQVDIQPDGEPVVLATHEQVLGGPTGQVYVGCRFPAEDGYAAQLGRHGQAIGHVLARRGAVGRFGADFAVAADATGRWAVRALEINLRKGGTTHPYTVLRNLAPGRYDPDPGTWVTLDGTPRCYQSTDNLLDPAWRGRPPREVIAAVAAGGLQFDPGTQTGVVLHMLSCLAIDGRCGLTAIGRSASHAGHLYDTAVELLAAQPAPAPR